MQNRIIFGLVFILTYGIQVSHAEFLNMGYSEMIILLIVGILFFGFFIGIFVLIYSLIKKSTHQPQTVSPNTVAINFGQPNNYQPQAVEKDQETVKVTTNIALHQQNETRYIDSKEVIRCEADNNYTNFHLNDGEKLLISKPLKEYADSLKPHGFVRTHQSHLVNLKFVKSWLKEDGGTLLMNNGDKIPVSKPNREMVKAALGK